MPESAQYFEALVGTLKAARKKGFIDWKGQMLLKGAHDDVEITLLVEPVEGAAAEEAATVEADAEE